MPEIRLTPREDEVLRHVRTGASNKEIAEDLGISEQGVKALVSRLLLKFQVPNRTTLASVSDRAVRQSAEAEAVTLTGVLKRSRELRMENRLLMDRLRTDMREVRQLRNTMVRRRNGGSATPDSPPRDRRRAP